MCNELRDPSHQTSDSPTLQRRSALPHRGIAMGAREAGGAVRWRLAPAGAAAFADDDSHSGWAQIG